MVAKTKAGSTPPTWIRWAITAGLTAIGLWFFPLFHLVRLSTQTAAVISAVDPGVGAERFWREQLPTAKTHEAAKVAIALKTTPKDAIATYAHQVGLGGTAYFFVRGEGRVVARESGAVRLALGEGDDAPVVELQTGLIFGNAVRDGTGLLDLNRFPSLQAFNALSAELNQLVELRVLPALRDGARVGTRVAFTGCAEAVEPSAGRPLLSLIPVRAEIR